MHNKPTKANPLNMPQTDFQHPEIPQIDNVAYSRVRLRATVISNERGLVEIEIPTYKLNSEEMEFLDRLFPNTEKHIRKVLAIESLLHCLADH